MGASAAASVVREPRGARRKRETRSRLLGAALALMARRGMEGVTIAEITEAADVGFGSFYNHFDSKEAIYDALVHSVFDDFADWLDDLLANVHDPAEVVAASVRHTILRAEKDAVWGQFLIREGLSKHSIDRGLGRRLLRDIKKGNASGRFSNDDQFMSFVSIAGTVMASIAFASKDVQLFSTKCLSQRCASSVLQILGIDRREADEIARRPLPK